MADYSIYVLGEGQPGSEQISLTGGVTIDGVTQGDGSHLVDEYLTINSTTVTELFISDGGTTDTNFADNDGNQLLDGAQSLDGTTYADGTRIEAEYRFTVLDESTGIEYEILAVNINNSSPSYGTNEALAFIGTPPPVGVPLRVVEASEGPPNGGPNAVDASEISPICLTRGTLVETRNGPELIEHLRLGDLMCTHEGCFQPLRYIYRRWFSRSDFERNPKLRPIRICAGAMGCGLPNRDLLVSPQHRMLVQSPIAVRMFAACDVLVPAIKLTALPGIFVDTEIEGIEYIHLLFDQHEVIFAEGTPTESLYTGPEALKVLSPETRAELFALFPEIATPDHSAKPACYIPSNMAQRALIARHLKNKKPLICQPSGITPQPAERHNLG
ncbi:hypothetical protein ROA7450_00274 [Roseovarius albus]|uniref:Hedgehog/Intein (Hint) domain-containing protein n=1 Tax=Roseovarius albus TaxID=1247867 RepID=A0A1X6YA26_9RHOB|nr:Hint domain-containing protein [Roseovarius albus]SLN14469.1 hypothetical protein ROA7450_00274 [Roseovarius albus]